MKVYTSYFARRREWERRGLFPIAICRFPPSWYEGAVFKELSPKPDLLRRMKDGDDGAVAEYYSGLVADFTPKEIMDTLREIAPEGKDIVLLCYEKPSDFCHRHLVAEYLNSDGYGVREFGDTQPFY